MNFPPEGSEPTTSPEALRPSVAVVGAGEISDYHIAGVQRAGGAVSMIVSRSETSASAKAAEFDIPGFSTDLEAALTDSTLAGVIVATPDSTHVEVGLACLEAGIPTMIQKPLALTSDECRTILDASARTGTPVYTSFMHRYFEEVGALRQLMQDGILGDVLHIRQRNATPGAGWAPWFYDKSKVSGGVMMQLGVHGIDLIRYVSGEITSVASIAASQVSERLLDSGDVVQSDVEDFMVATYKLANGGIVTHEMSYNEVSGTDRFRMEVYGSEGTAWLRTPRGRLAISTRDNPGTWAEVKLPAAPLGQLHHEHFLRMALAQAPDDGSGQDGYQTMVIAETAYLAASAGIEMEVQRP